MEYRVISADNHILEPRDLFVTRLPAEWPDRAPRVLKGADGGEGWSLDGGPPKRTFGIEATAGRAVKVSGYTWEDILPGNYDGAAHVADMLAEGVDASVIFPSVPLHAWFMKDDPFALALIQTFNDWLFDDFVAADPKRLVGLPLMPVNHSMDVLLAELDRCLKLGARAIHIPVYPDTPYLDAHYEPFWAAVAEAGVPMCIHRTSGGVDPLGKNLFQFALPGVNVAGTVIRFFSGVEPLTLMIFSGLFQRHPGLKIMDAEVNFGWIPFWKQTMDDLYELQKGWARFPFDGPPSRFLGRNVFVSVLDDKLGFDLVERDPYLADTALFSLDYPHSVCLWPNTADHIARAAANCPAEAKQKILAGNAIKLFGLD